ncbi:MAG: phage portal protein, partial [Myxococcota bacterium]
MNTSVRTSWWGRLVPSLPRWLRSLVIPWHPGTLGGGDISIGAGAAGTVPARAPFPPLKSLSAMAAFPTVWAAANAISLDLAGLPIRVQLGEGSNAEVLPEHPFLELLRQPSSSCTERRLRRQLYVDETLTGNGVIWLDSRGEVPALRRLHPQHAVPEVNAWGDILRWTYGPHTLSPTEVHLVAGPSWSDDVSMVLGESPIRPLEHDLEAMRQSKRHAAHAARSGRPDFHFSAPADSPLISEKAMNKVVEKFEDLLAGGRRAVFSAGGLEAQQLTWPLRDLEYQSVVELSEKAALIVLGTPAVRLGLPNANYGEAKVQMRQYWEGLLYRAAAWDDALTPIARALDPQGRPVRVRHDATNIEALQNSFDQRQQRAAIWVQTFGASPADAARYEGFPDAPTGAAGD